MFNKTADQTPAPNTAMPPARPSSTKSVFSSDLKITGEVTSAGDIEMTGEIDGNVIARAVVIGADGRMNGTVKAETVEVKGKLDGQVSAGSFMLRASAQVAADVAYSALVIESGATIEGNFSKLKA